jgi:gamma-glutamylcyclotransferase (GGCT)/AIG2-like uncharacterized protein YtfP
MPNPDHIFVYGTLLPGLAPRVIADVVAQLRLVGPATVRGWLYDLGAYPGCVLDGDCGRLVHGQLLELTDLPMQLERLDGYEGCAAHDDTGQCLFVRTTCDAIRPDGSAVRAWVYVYNRDVSRARRIESGRYRKA